MSQTMVNFRMDADLKKAMDETCKAMGMTATAAYTIFAKKVTQEQRIPFEIVADPFDDEDLKMIREYTAVNGLDLSTFIRDTVLDTIEDSLQMDEQRILDAWKRSEHERRYTHEEMLQELSE